MTTQFAPSQEQAIEAIKNAAKEAIVEKFDDITTIFELKFDELIVKLQERISTAMPTMRQTRTAKKSKPAPKYRKVKRKKGVEQANSRWTPEEDAKLLTLVELGLTPAMISGIMGRTRQAISGRKSKLTKK